MTHHRLQTVLHPVSHDAVASTSSYYPSTVECSQPSLGQLVASNPSATNHTNELMSVDSFGQTMDAIIRGPKQSNSRAPRVRTTRPTVFCELCGSTFSCKGNLNRHRRVTHQGKRVRCHHPECTESFSQMTDMTRHYRRIHLNMRFKKASSYKRRLKSDATVK